jgi:hypothetical protein
MDEEFRELIKQASEFRQDTPERAKTISLLRVKIQQLPGFYQSSHQDYFDALDQTWEWFGRNIQDFEERPPLLTVSLVRWINGYLHWRIRDIRDKRNQTISLDARGNEDGTVKNFWEVISETGFEPPRLSGIDSYIEKIQQQNIDLIAQKLKQYIEQDPDFVLRNLHLQKNPECNFQVIIQRLYLKDKHDTKRAIAEYFGVSEQTLYAHYRRNWSKIQLHLQEVALNSGLEEDYLL